MSSSHLINPLGFRAGKSHLWTNNSLLANAQNKLLDLVNTPQGLESSLAQLLLKDNFLVVKSSSSINPHTNITVLNVLYYPMYAPFMRKRKQPAYLSRRLWVNKIYKLDTFNGSKLLTSTLNSVRMFALHKTNRKKYMKEWVIKNILLQARYRGMSVKRYKNLGNNYKTTKPTRRKGIKHFNKFLLANIKPTVPLKWARFLRKSGSALNSRRISKQLAKRTGYRVKLNLINVFSYLQKRRKANMVAGRDIYFNRKYSYYSKRFESFYDVVNAYYIMSYIPKSEHLFISLLQYAMSDMDKKGFRPKHFFYFLSSIATNMSRLKLVFAALRLVITGKLGGGTGRTKTLSVGFGALPKQTVSANLRYGFGDLHSKYGAYGLRLFTWRYNKLRFIKFKIRARRVYKELKGHNKENQLLVRRRLYSMGQKKVLVKKLLKTFKRTQMAKIKQAKIQNKFFKQMRFINPRITKEKSLKLFNKRIWARRGYTQRLFIKKRRYTGIKKKAYKRLKLRSRYCQAFVCGMKPSSCNKYRLIKWKESKRTSKAKQNIIQLHSGVFTKFKAGTLLANTAVAYKLRQAAWQKDTKRNYKKRKFRKFWHFLSAKKRASKYYHIRASVTSITNKQAKLYFAKKNKIRAKRAFNANVSLNKLIKLKKVQSKNYLKKSWRWGYFGRKRKTAFGLAKKILANTITKRVKWLSADNKSILLSKYLLGLYGKKHTLRLIDYRNWKLQFLANNQSAPNHVRVLSSKAFNLLKRLFLGRLMLKYSTKRVLVAKIFKFPNKTIFGKLFAKWKKGSFGTKQFEAIAKKADRYRGLSSSPHLEKLTSAIIVNAEGRATKLEEMLKTRNFFVHDKVNAPNLFSSSNKAASIYFPSLSYISQYQIDNKVPVQLRTNKRFRTMLNDMREVKKSTDEIFKKPYSHRMVRNFWVRRFYAKKDYGFSIPAGRMNSLNVLQADMFKNYSKQANGSWETSLSLIDGLSDNIAGIKRNAFQKKNLKYNKRLKLFGKQLLDSTLGLTSFKKRFKSR